MGVAIAAVAVAIALVMSSDSIPNALVGPEPPEPAPIMPVDVHVDEIRILSMTAQGASLELVLTLTNPNPQAAILSLVKYQITEGGERVAAGQIGSRSEGMVDASDYYTILGGGSITLRDQIDLDNSGGAQRFWTALETGTTSWNVTGEAFFNLSSMTAGQENEVLFAQVLD